MRVHLSARLKMDSYGNGEQIDPRYDARRARRARGPRLRWSLTPYVTIKYNAGPLSRFQDVNPFGDEGLSRRTPTPSSRAAAGGGVRCAVAAERKGVLTKLRWLDLASIQVTDAGCAISSPLRSGSTAALCQRSRNSIWLTPLPARRRQPP